MDVIEAINSRKSVRGYKPDPVPREVIEEILRIATRAPSGMNSQPWELTVITGEVMEKIKQANVEQYISGEAPNPDAIEGVPTGKYRERQIGLATQLFKLMNIAREDKKKRAEWTRRGLRFLDAPAAIIVSMDKSLGEIALLSVGAFAQTFALAALNYGLGTAIQGHGVLYPDVIRRFTGIPASKRILICLIIGYPDWDFPANKIQSEREPLDNITTWCGI